MPILLEGALIPEMFPKRHCFVSLFFLSWKIIREGVCSKCQFQWTAWPNYLTGIPVMVYKDFQQNYLPDSTAAHPWVYEPIRSLGFSLLVVTRPHTDTYPMRWLLWNSHLMVWSCPCMALTKNRSKSWELEYSYWYTTQVWGEWTYIQQYMQAHLPNM